jgi:ATP-dependent DNA helicase RecG
VTSSLQQLQQWLSEPEGEHLEFKEAKNGFHFEKIVKYCAALANEGGGSIILGVTDRRPRRVVGTGAFDNLERTKAGLVERLRLRVEAIELQHPDGRVLVFTAPARAMGVPVAVEGAYWMRAGEDLVPMTTDMLRSIFEEAGPDFSAETCPDARMEDLDPKAIETFRQRWHARSGLASILSFSPEHLLQDADLITGHRITYAALILLGTRSALLNHLPSAEVIFEYRSREVAGPANQREEFVCGFLLCYDRLWELINLRNDKQHYQDGFVMLDVPTFSEGSVREAILNAVSHRDYRNAGSVFVRQFCRRIEIVSPGGFPAGQASLTLHGEVQDEGFLQFLERVRQDGAAASAHKIECNKRGRVRRTAGSPAGAQQGSDPDLDEGTEGGRCGEAPRKHASGAVVPGRRITHVKRNVLNPQFPCAFKISSLKKA